MRSLAASFALGALLLLPGAAGATATSVIAQRAVVGVAFWSAWGYDWDDRFLPSSWSDTGETPRLVVVHAAP